MRFSICCIVSHFIPSLSVVSFLIFPNVPAVIDVDDELGKAGLVPPVTLLFAVARRYASD